jgi:hypothetical protein
MSTRFDIGEIAIFVNPASPRHMEECCIVEGLQPGRIVDDATMAWRAGEFYRVTFDGDDIKYAAEPHQLRKKPGPGLPPETKREPLASWDDCAFQPSERVTSVE